ncbi:MAG: YeeE/YedE family protein [Alphaproteobacteria bacterium]|nr:YeeE/YedE family protein [Alphaproteobacteria bacterium]
MSVELAILTGVLMGIVFGFALEKGRVFEPGVIVGQMQLSNFIMLKVFLTAIATGSLALAALTGFEIVTLHPKATFYAADVIGGGLLGVGIALAGACPGTVLAQAGAGYRDALFTLAGGLAGAFVYSIARPAIEPVLLAEGPGKITFADVSGVAFPVLAVGLAAVVAVVLFALEQREAWARELSRSGVPAAA